MEPASDVGADDPAFALPFLQGLAGFDFEAIEGFVWFIAEFGVFEPVCGEFTCAIIHIFAFEDAHFQHLFGAVFRGEDWIEILAYRGGEGVFVVRLHMVINGDDLAGLEDVFSHDLSIVTCYKEFMKDFAEQLEALQAKGRYRSLQLAGALDLTSNDYLGLARSDVLRERALVYLNDGGVVGAAGSRLLRGHMDEHASLEAYAAAFFKAPAALYFSSGFQANYALFTTLCGRHDTVVYDELLHASARDGIEATHARGVRVRHNDVQAFEDALQAANEGRRTGGRIWVAVESVYSMDGDMAPLDALYALCERYDAWLIVDEAHATGVLGEQGRGAAYVHGYDRMVSLHTCGKALGVAGGLVCASEDVVAYLVNKARGFIYSTAPLPLQAVLVEEALRVVGSDEGEQRRTDLRARCEQVRMLLGGSGSHIVPIMIGDDARAVEVAEALQEAGYDIRAIRPPTVPEGTARLRLSLSSALKESDLAGFADRILPLLDKKAA